jgi:hypothetical protein
MTPERALVYRFFELPHLVRLDIARELNLLHDSDEESQDFKLFEGVFKRAKQDAVLAELWDRIEEAHNDGKYSRNPFQHQVT